MSLAQLPEEGDTFPGDAYVFACGDYHDVPVPKGRDRSVIIGRWFGIYGEGHILGGTHGRDIFARATYHGAASLAVLLAAIELDDSQEFVGDLYVNGLNYGPATFFGIDGQINPQVDGKDGTWFCDVVLKWRLRQ